MHGAFPSHAQVLLRSHDFETNENIDVIFFDVKFLNIPFDIKGIVIEHDTNENEFLISSQGNPDVGYKIKANHFQVFENQLDFYETSLGVLDFQGRERKIYDSKSDT